MEPYYNAADGIALMVGETPTKVVGEKGGDYMEFVMESGKSFRFYHYQDCCECVTIEDIVGDLKDLVGAPLLKAEQVSSGDAKRLSDLHDSYTWTFYKFASVKGYVDVRWYGESNGYYSEGVSLSVTHNE